MSTVRQKNWLGNGRVDVSHAREIEAATAFDFDLLVGQIMAGKLGMVVSGFEILGSSTSGQADKIQLVVDGASVIHPLATESGTIFNVPDGTANDVLDSSNSRVVGSFLADSTNYIGIDLRRSADASTSDVVQFYQPETDSEVGEDVPLARTLDYKIYISTNDFTVTPGLLPIAKVVTDSTNGVSTVEDCRWMLGRLGSGGSTPDAQYAYPWPGGRSEAGDNSSSTEGDRKITDLKSILDSLRSRLWEVGGGEYWYSPTADRNVKMIRTGSPFTSTGDWFEWVSSNLHWQGLKFVFDNSTGYVNEVVDQSTDSAGLTDLADGECVYVDLDRTQNLTGGDALVVQKAPLTTLGTPTVPGSRFILAWRYGSNIYTRESTYLVGMVSPVATTSTVGTVKLAYTPGAPSAPVVAPINANGQVVLNLAADNTHASLSVTGFAGVGTNGGPGISVTGGSSTTTLAGNAIQATGGAGVIGQAAISATGGSGTSSSGGNGANLSGGTSTGANSGHGFTGSGGSTTTHVAGYGGIMIGGTASGAGYAGQGFSASGGAVSGTGLGAGLGGSITGGASSTALAGAVGVQVAGGANTNAGDGGAGTTSTGGAASGAGSGGIGAIIAGGANSSTGAAGVGATITAGARSGSGDGANGLNVTGGAGITSGTGGDGISATSGTGAGSSQGGVAVRGTAGANGGRAALFTKSITDVTAATTLDATGVTIAKVASGQLNIAPALKFTLANGDEINHFTHLGFPTAQIHKLVDHWDYGAVGDITTAPSIWSTTGSFSGGGSTAVALNGPSTTYASSSLDLQTISGSAGEVASRFLATTRAIIPRPDALAHGYLQAEFVISTTSSAFTDANAEYWIGFTDNAASPDTAGANTAMFRYKGGTDTTAFAAFTSNSGASSATACALAPTTTGSPDQVLKVEFFGSSSELGANTIVFTINGVQQVAKTTNIPNGNMKVCFLVKSKTAASATRNLRVGGFEVYWNPMGLTALKR